MDYNYEYLKKSADYISSIINYNPEIAIVLGSCLGDIASEIKNQIVIDYKDIPNFLTTTVDSHAGKLIFGDLSGKKIICMSGRFHHYEGYSFEQLKIPVRVLKLLGVKKLILTNAAGGINESYKPGDIMIIRDHINAVGKSPLIGANDKNFGDRFFDMTNAYDKDLICTVREASEDVNIKLREGIYFYTTGPQFETPAEIKYMRRMGADAVGMSTVPEVIVAVHCGIKVIGLSLISNMAAGVLDIPVTTKEVDDTARETSEKFKELLKSILLKI